MLTVCNSAFIDLFFAERSQARCPSPADRVMRSLFCELLLPRPADDRIGSVKDRQTLAYLSVGLSARRDAVDREDPENLVGRPAGLAPRRTGRWRVGDGERE
jgi:hypothetical protein